MNDWPCSHCSSDCNQNLSRFSMKHDKEWAKNFSMCQDENQIILACVAHCHCDLWTGAMKSQSWSQVSTAEACAQTCAACATQACAGRHLGTVWHWQIMYHYSCILLEPIHVTNSDSLVCQSPKPNPQEVKTEVSGCFSGLGTGLEAAMWPKEEKTTLGKILTLGCVSKNPTIKHQRTGPHFSHKVSIFARILKKIIPSFQMCTFHCPVIN